MSFRSDVQAVTRELRRIRQVLTRLLPNYIQVLDELARRGVVKRNEDGTFDLEE